MGEARKLSYLVGKFEVGKKVDLGKLSRESDGRESCSREKDVAPLKVQY